MQWALAVEIFFQNTSARGSHSFTMERWSISVSESLGESEQLLMEFIQGPLFYFRVTGVSSQSALSSNVS